MGTRGVMFFALCCTFFMLMACTSGRAEQEKAPVQDNKEPGDITLGSFRKIPVDSAEAVRAYEFFKGELGKNHPQFVLRAVINAEIQVVAGYNIRLFCEYTDEKGERKYLRAIIYRDIAEKMSVTELTIDVKKIH